ncbi:MAG: DUF1501 domain-containing protein [bacterium]|nr:DUF1501 domain-containing protein [bacterium]
MWTRRAFMKGSGVALFSLSFGGTPLFLSRAADAAHHAGANHRRKILVTIFQRGAMDGLMAVTPYNDPELPGFRPQLFMQPGQAKDSPIDLDGHYAFHPAFTPMVDYFKEGRLAIVHGVGSPEPTRSHFDAQDYMENGTPGVKSTRSGWLNRAVGLLGHEGTPFRAVSMTQALPRSFYGSAPALAIANLRDFGIRAPGDNQSKERVEAGFEHLYQMASKNLLKRVANESFDAIDMMAKIDVLNYKPAKGAKYPNNSPLGNRLRQIAQLVKAEVGLEVAFTETGGWDTHVQQGTTVGSFSRRATDLSKAINAFWTDLGPYQDDVVLITMTEFGRTVRQNGSRGTDHGRGSCLFVLGNSVDGGKVHGTVPVLATENLADGRDLPVTTDFRSVFSEVAGKHLNIKPEDDAKLFPGWTGQRLPLIKS